MSHLIRLRLLEAFDNIIVINLRSRTDRRRQMVAELRKLQLDVDTERVFFLDASVFAEEGDFPSKGARGCFDSHLRCLRLAVQKNLRSVLILEDDCDLVGSPQRWERALDALAKTDWAIFYGGYKELVTLAGECPGPVFQVPSVAGIECAHFVGFRGKAILQAKNYLETMLTRAGGSREGGPMHVDGAYSWFRATNPALETWAAAPILGRQRPSRTNIHALKWMDKGMMRPISAAVRLMRWKLKGWQA